MPLTLSFFVGCVLCTFPVIDSFCISKLIGNKLRVCDSYRLCLLKLCNHIMIWFCTYCMTSRCICSLKQYVVFWIVFRDFFPQLLRLIQLLSIKTKRTIKQKQNMEIFLFPFQLEGDERKNLDQVFIWPSQFAMNSNHLCKCFVHQSLRGNDGTLFSLPKFYHTIPSWKCALLSIEIPSKGTSFHVIWPF